LWSAALDGSDAEQLTACPNTCSIQLVVPSPDGRQIAYLAQPSDGMPIIRIVGVDGEDDRALDTGGMLAKGAFSPDGRQLAFLRSRQANTPLGAENSVWVVSTAGGEPRQVSPWEPLVSAPLWADDEHLLYSASASFAASSGQVYRIAVTAGAEPEALTGGSLVAISPDRTKLLVALESSDTIVPDTRFAHAVIDLGDPSQPLATLALRPGQYIWSPDSARLAGYTAYNEVLLVDATSGQETLLRPGPARKEPYGSELSWSRDGQSVIYSAPGAGPKPAFALRRLAVDGSGEAVLLQLPLGTGSTFALTP
jgi:dipeptidyl aminopeptidase/acylaminoacyl peptidase